MKRAFAFVAIVASMVVIALGATTSGAPQSGAISNADVIKMARAGLSNGVILQAIEKADEVTFDTSTDALIELKTAGVSDQVIQAIVAAEGRSSRSAPAPAVSSAAPPAPAAANRTPLRVIDGGVLDKIALFVDRVPGIRVAIRPFSATDADIVKGEKKDETKTMQADGPRMLAESFVAKLMSEGSFTDVSVAEGDAVPPDTLIVTGKFIELDPGSRAKRYFAGFGAGKSAVSVSGSVLSPGGVVIATFEQRRIGVMGIGGGDSLGKLRSDAKSIGQDIASFMNAWATGKKLK